LLNGFHGTKWLKNNINLAMYYKNIS
jgi:hypothetical protein